MWQARLAALEAKIARQLKIARALGTAGLAEEARPSVLETIRLQGSALAIRHRLPEPESAAAALQPPIALRFGEELPVLRKYLEDESAPWEPIVGLLACAAPQ